MPLRSLLSRQRGSLTKLDFNKVCWDIVSIQVSKWSSWVIGLKRFSPKKETGTWAQSSERAKERFSKLKNVGLRIQSGASRLSRQLGNFRSIYSISLEGKTVAKTLLNISLKISDYSSVRRKGISKRTDVCFVNHHLLYLLLSSMRFYF
jgi:hypothetical protein